MLVAGCWSSRVRGGVRRVAGKGAGWEGGYTNNGGGLLVLVAGCWCWWWAAGVGGGLLALRGS